MVDFQSSELSRRHLGSFSSSAVRHSIALGTLDSSEGRFWTFFWSTLILTFSLCKAFTTLPPLPNPPYSQVTVVQMWADSTFRIPGAQAFRLVNTLQLLFQWPFFCSHPVLNNGMSSMYSRHFSSSLHHSIGTLLRPEQ